MKDVYLFYLLSNFEKYSIRSAIIFCGTCACCKLVKYFLDELGFESTALNSRMAQQERFEALDRFKSGRVSMLVATDVASRGLDIATVDLVINYELPKAPRDYVHRVGRTARAGRPGQSVSLISQHDITLLHRIEQVTKEKLTEFKTSEHDVLRKLSKVSRAKKGALLKLAKDDLQKKSV